MDKKEIFETVKNEFPELEIELVRQGKEISVYGFHLLGNRAEECKKRFESLGFSISANSARLR